MTDSQPFDALLTDELLVHVRQGSHDAWREVYRRYRPFLTIAAQGLSGAQAQDVDDVLQSAFLSAWKEIEGFSYRGKNSFRAWLRAIVINKNLSELRKRGRRASVRNQSQLGTEFISEIKDKNSVSPSDEAVDDDARQMLLKCMEEYLTDLEREVVTLVHFEHLNATQVAGIVELDPRTVRRHYKLAMEKIQRCLTDQGRS